VTSVVRDRAVPVTIDRRALVVPGRPTAVLLVRVRPATAVVGVRPQGVPAVTAPPRTAASPGVRLREIGRSGRIVPRTVIVRRGRIVLPTVTALSGPTDRRTVTALSGPTDRRTATVPRAAVLLADDLPAETAEGDPAAGLAVPVDVAEGVTPSTPAIARPRRTGTPSA